MSDATAADWAAWHRDYDDPSSRLSRRLAVVQEHLRGAIDTRPGSLRIISMCAGEGRDVIGVLAGHPRAHQITARLVELDPRIAGVARAGVRDARLEHVEVIRADAGLTDSYTGAVPAEIILACGIFGNIADEHVRRTIAHLPGLCAPGATVLWTRGRERDRDFALTIRSWFAESGFDEIAYVAPGDHGFRVGVNRLIADPSPFAPGARLFEFIDSRRAPTDR